MPKRQEEHEMSKKIYVGNLNYATNEDSLGSLFTQYGEVVSTAVIVDRYTNRSKGFGFVEMADDSSADKAIEDLNGKEFEGRKLRVNVAEERQRRPRPNAGDRY